MSETRRAVVSTGLAIVVSAAVLGCSGSAGAPMPAPRSTQDVQPYDLSRLSELRADFPPGFVPGRSEVRKLHKAFVPSVGAVVSGSKPFVVYPGGCRALLKPVDGIVDSESIGIRADAPEKRSIAVGAYLPVEFPAAIPATGCDRMTYVVPDDDYPVAGSVERIAAPNIEGAITLALKSQLDGFPDPEYFYAAILGDGLYVNVQARLARDFAAQPLLPDLLVKAVATIRGR